MQGILYFNAIILALSAKAMAVDVLARAYCPPSGQHFFASPKRCSQFVACDNGEYRIVDCVNGLHFNPTYGWCDLPENVGCIQAEDKTGPGIDDKYDEDDKMCSQSGQYFLPYPYDCSLFIECNNGQYNIISCIYGLHFNRNLGWCDFPENAACVDLQRPPNDIPSDDLPIDDPPNYIPSDDLPIDDPPNDTPKDEGGPDGTCPSTNNPVTVYFLAHTRDCSIFYKCDWGRPIEMRCAAGLHFNRVLNVCDWPWSAGCTAGK